MRKSKLEMLSTILDSMATRQGITETSPGSVARTFAEIMVEEFYPFYEELDNLTTMAYVTSAVGTYLDLIGALLNCKRLDGEIDDDYRTRITEQIYVVQGANIIALRTKAISIDGVAEVDLIPFTHGAGSFTCYVIPTSYPITNEILDSVQEIVNETCGFGIYGEVKASTAIPIDISIQLVFHNQTTNAERQSIRQNVSAAVERYVNEIGMGEPWIVNETIQRVMDVSPKILDMQIFQLTVKENNMYVRNIYPRKEEQYFLRRISVT